MTLPTESQLMAVPEPLRERYATDPDRWASAIISTARQLMGEPRGETPQVNPPSIQGQIDVWRRIRSCPHRDECGCTKWKCNDRGGERVGKEDCERCPKLPE